MATLDELVARRELRRLTVELGKGEFNDRQFYSTPDFRAWLFGPVMKAEPFRVGDLTPAQQARDLLRQFNSGKPFPDVRLFKIMSPATNDVWEFSKPDFRIFGWFPEKDRFLAVCGDFFEPLKLDASLYEKYRLSCVECRNAIGLNEPKYTPGAKYADVISV